MNLRSLIKGGLRRLGVEVRRVREPAFGESLGPDLRRLLPDSCPPVILDVGANVGQSVERFSALFPGATIHAIEPSPESFAMLVARCGGREHVRLWNTAVGAAAGRATLNENVMSGVTSFLEPGRDGLGEIVRRTTVDVTTLDDFLRAQALERVDLLKTDTEGYELEVLRGAAGALREGRVRLLLCELQFASYFEGGARPDRLYSFLQDHDYALIGCYELHHRGRLAGYADALFVHRGYYEEHLLRTV